MLSIGLTGGIGSGKSIVAQIFRTLGIPVLDADALAKKIMQENKEVKNQIIAAFGGESYNQQGLNRSYISNIVFKDPYQLQLLNSIVHPATIEAGKIWASQQNAPYTIKEAALFFESGSAEGMDIIIGVYAPDALRIQRVIQRDQINREEVLNRMNHQISQSIKMKLCDRVIINDEQSLLIPQVLQLHIDLTTY
ncbi:MAG: dephospho-CoA kinase [Sphingobacteriia bacterium 28-36-52]|nr:MAG: dephospho-CoA kinase [Sphingobacteriia bacterium 32-37-4]OYZ00235.1 MAG: dephospho-CoA kinase [Sphingobacteriia bacterium 28-36-52]